MVRPSCVLGAAAAALLLTACGTGASRPAAPADAVTVAPLAATPTASPLVTTATPRPTPRSHAVAPVSMTFAIVPLFAGGARGTVTAVVLGSHVRYHVVVSGLVAGSAHTIHEHLGSCGAPNSSSHLAILDTSTAAADGVIVFDTTVPGADFGRGRIVIVYSSARPLLITGCAAL